MISILEWFLGVSSIYALVASVFAIRESAMEREASFTEGNGDAEKMRKVAVAHLRRDWVRAFSALVSVIGAVHLLVMPPCESPPALVSKYVWAVFLVLLLANIYGDSRDRRDRLRMKLLKQKGGAACH